MIGIAPLGRRGLAAVAAVLILSGCADDESPSTAAPPPSAVAARPAFKVQSFLPDEPTPPPQSAQDAASSAAPARTNDPSAPIDTPLCGQAEREASNFGAMISPGVTSSGNACLGTACFDPATGTFVGADGYRHVCQ